MDRIAQFDNRFILRFLQISIHCFENCFETKIPQFDNRINPRLFLQISKYISFVRRTSRSSTETRKLFYDGQNSIIESIHDFFYKFLNTYHLHVKHLHRRQSKLFRILVPNSIIGSFHKFFTFLDSNEQIIYLIPDKKEKISQFDRRENYSNFYWSVAHGRSGFANRKDQPLCRANRDKCFRPLPPPFNAEMVGGGERARRARKAGATPL